MQAIRRWSGSSWLILTVGVAAVVSSALLLLSPAQHARYEGRRLDQWVADLSGPLPQPREQAIVFFKRGTESIAMALVPIIQGRGTRFSRWFFSHHTARRFIPSRSMLRRVYVLRSEAPNAIFACSLMGNGAHDALPAIISMKSDYEASVRSRVAQALGEIRSDPARTVPILIGMLSDPDSGRPQQCCGVLGLLRRSGKTRRPSPHQSTERSSSRWCRALRFVDDPRARQD